MQSRGSAFFAAFWNLTWKTSNSMIKKQWCSCHSCLLYIRIIFCELHSHVRSSVTNIFDQMDQCCPSSGTFTLHSIDPWFSRQGRNCKRNTRFFRSFHIRMQNGKCIHLTACEKKQYIYIVHLYIFINEFQHKYVGPSSLFFSVRKRSVSNWKLFALGILIHKRHVHLDHCE